MKKMKLSTHDEDIHRGEWNVDGISIGKLVWFMSAIITHIETNLRILKMGTTKLFFYFPVRWQIVYEWITKKIDVESGALDCLLRIKMINQKWRVLFCCEKWLRHDRVTAIFQISIWEFCPPIIRHIKNSINWIILLYVFPWLHISLCEEECEEIVLAMIDYMTDSIHNGKLSRFHESEGHNNRRILHSPLDILLFN